MAELVFFRRTEEMMRVVLDGRRVAVGRGSGVDILVPDASISRQQFAVERQGETWRVVDLSGRGTDCAGKKVQQAELSDGVDLGLGQWRAVFNLADRLPVDEGTTEIHRGDTQIRPESDAPLKPVAAFIRARTGPSEKTLPVSGELLVGSGEQCGLRLEDPFVSATHLKIERRGGTFVARDLSSTNGTWLGAVRIWEAELPFDRPLNLGDTELVLFRGTGEVAAFEGIVGADPAMHRVFETIERVAPSSAAVAIFGESGSGKELVARAIHARSPRAKKPFLPINCGALSRELVEAELFGHEKGSFTGAERQHRGAFEEADGGTLFLDEIGELPLEMQSKLLRALESGEVKRVGAARPMHVDVRIVAATNRDLRNDVRNGRFREDLYWRLCVIPLQLPPLRARKSDLKALTAHFLRLFSPPGAPVTLGKDAEKKLLDYDWPGNVRELKNTLHRSLLLRQGDRIEDKDVQFDRDLDRAAQVAEPARRYDPSDNDLTTITILDKKLEQIDDEVFLKTWKRLGDKPTAIAKALGVSRGAVYRNLQRLGIGAPPAHDEA